MSFWISCALDSGMAGNDIEFRSSTLLLYFRDNIVPFRYYYFTDVSA